MIRINLLPEIYAKKAAARVKILMIGGVAGLVVALFVGTFFMRVAKLKKLEKEISSIQVELDDLQPIVKKINSLNKQKKNMNNKIDVIEELLKLRILYPVFMEDFAGIIPPKVWIKALSTKTSGENLGLDMSVLAMDNYAAADFLNALELSDKFSAIKFAGLSTVSMKGEALEIRTFNIDCNYSFSGSKKKPVEEKGKKKKRKKRKKRKKG